MQVCAQNPPLMYITQPTRGTLDSKGMQMAVVGMPAGGRILQQLLRSKTVSLSQPRQSTARTVMAVWCGTNHRPLASSSFPGPWRWSVSTPGWTTSQSWSRGLAGTPAYWPAWNAAGKRIQTGDLELKWLVEAEEEMKAMERRTEESRLKAGHSAHRPLVHRAQ